MSRLDKAIAALDGAVSDLTAAVDARLAADNEAQNAQVNETANGASGIADEDLRAMKSELHEAMSLLQAMQDEPQNQEGQ
jgi:hypothetical protein